MEARNVQRSDLQAALDATNTLYEDNIRFKRIDALNTAATRWRFTLTVESSKAPGARRSASAIRPDRRIAAACWHVHGHFFEALFAAAPDARIKAGAHTITGPTAANGNWQDWQIGSLAYPIMYSDACDCNN